MTSAGRPTLLLVPTELEARKLEQLGGLRGAGAIAATIGFGAVAAAASTAALLARFQPRRALLLGIAGSYDEARHPIGSALCFARVAIDGLGAGEGDDLLAPAQLGFPLAPVSSFDGGASDELALACPPDARGDGALLLTVCAASSSSAQATRRKHRHPRAVAED